MSAANIRAGIEISAEVRGEETIAKLAKTIEEAGVDTSELTARGKELSQTFARLDKATALAGQFKTLKTETKKVADALELAQEKTASLARAMAANPSKDLEKQFKAAAAEAGRLKRQKAELAEQTHKTRKALAEAGVSAANLAQEERRLAAESKQAQNALDKLNREARELKALADARITLGIDSDNKALAEIDKANRAYEMLKNSGTLSQAELARAAELHRHKVYELETGLKALRPSLADIAGEMQNIVTRAGGLALVTREAVRFETAMAGVKKVVDGTPEQIDGLKNRIKELAAELGIVPDKLAEIAAQGGQLGISLDRLPEFTQMAAQMSVAFNMSAEEAGNAAATIANVFQLPIEKVGELGDAVNVLGNNTAAREKDIVAAMARIGGTAKQFGLAADEAAALADALIALGRPPEVAATAINAMLSKLQTGESQSKAFQDALRTLGTSAGQLAADIQADPQQALLGFLKTLEALDKQSRAMVLTEMFGTEYSDDLALLVGSLKEYEKALSLVTDKGRTVGAMQAEVDAAMSTTEAKLNQAKATFSAAASTIGDALLPAVAVAARSAANVAEAVGSVAQQFPVLTQLAVLYASLRVGMAAYEAAVRLTGASAASSFFKTRISIDGVKTALAGAHKEAVALNAEMAKNNASGIGKSAGAVQGLAGKLGGALNIATALTAAFSGGFGIGEALYESSLGAQYLGDELGRALAYADALFTDRTFEDVRKLYKTSAEARREQIHLEAEQKRAAEARAEAQKQAAEQETARIAALRRQYRSLTAEQAALERSMKTLQSAGLQNSAAYAALKTQSAELAEAAGRLKEKLTQAGQGFSFDRGPVAEAKNALESLGLTAEQVADGISKDAAQALDDFSKAAAQFGNDGEQMARIFKAALAKMDSPEAVEALRARLEAVGRQAGLTADEIAKIGDKAPDAAEKVRAAFAQIGVDTDAVTEGIGAKAKQAFADFQTASELAREQGVNDARLIRNGFEQIMGKLQSRAEFAAFREQLAQSGRTADLTREQLNRLNEAAKNGADGAKTAYEGLAQAVKAAADDAALQNLAEQAKRAFSDGLITAVQYDQTLAEVKRRSAEVAAQSATMGEAAKTAHEQAAQAARTHADAEAQTANAAAQAAQGADKAATSAVRRVTRLHEVFSTQYGNIKLTREEFAALNAEIDRFNVGQPESMSVSRWIQYKNQLQAVKDGFAAVIRNAEAAGETVSQMAREGTISQQALARATQAAAEATGKLDAVRLSKLHAQIDEARQKLRQMQDEAKEARETLEAELAGLNGNEEAAHELEARRKIEAWKKKAAEASDAGAAAEYRKAAELQEQVYRRQREKREAERQAKQEKTPDLNALAEPQVNIGGQMAAGFIEELNRTLDKRDEKVAAAAAQALIGQLREGLRRMT